MERNRNIISLLGVGQDAYGTMSLYLDRVAAKLIKWISSCKYSQWISRNPEHKFLMTFSTQRQSSRNFQSSATSIGSDALLERAFRWTWGCLLCHLKVYYKIQNTLFYCCWPVAVEFLNLSRNVLLPRNWKMESPRASLGHHYRSPFED